MTDIKSPSAAYVAPIEETERLSHLRLRDLLGGTGWAIVFGVAIVLVVLFDVWGQRLIWREIMDPPKEFLHCDFVQGGPAGFFSWALLGLTGVLGAALWYLAPSSLLPTWIFVAVVMLLQFLFAYGDGSGTPRLSDALETLVFQREVTCRGDGVALEDRVLLRYNPAEMVGQTPENNDVSVDFTNTLLLNLILLAAYSALASFLAGLKLALWPLVRRHFLDPNAHVRDPSHIQSWFNLHGPERTIVIQASLFMLIAAMVGPSLVPFFGDPGGVTASVENSLWIAPLVLLLDIARLAFWTAPAPDDAVSSPERAPEQERPKVLEAVANGLGSTLPKASHFKMEAVRDPKDDSRAGVAADFGDAGKPAPGKCHLFLETLTDDHFNVMRDVLNTSILDSGYSALVVCPLEALSEVETKLRENRDLFGRNAGEFFPRWLKLDEHAHPSSEEKWEENQPWDVILTTPESLEIIARDPVEFGPELARLGAIFIISLHRMDLGFLRVAMLRIEQYVVRSRDVIGLVHAETHLDAENWVANLPILNALSRIQSAMGSLQLATEAHVVTAVQDPQITVSSVDAFPVEWEAVTEARRLDDRADSFFLDRSGAFSEAVWRQRFITPMMNRGAPKPEIEWATGMQAPVLGPINLQHPMAVFPDNSNLADAVSTSAATPAAHEALTVVVQGHYPTARFLRDEIATLSGGAVDQQEIRSAVGKFRREFGAIMPMPDSGPIELAVTILREFIDAERAASLIELSAREAADGWVSQARIAEIWRDGSIVALGQLGAANTPAGLERLFKRTIAAGETGDLLEKKHHIDRTWLYRVAPGALPYEATLPLMRFVNQGNQIQSDQPFFTPLADHGLAYARHIRIALAGRVYRVDHVDDGRRQVNLEADDGAPAEKITFVRDYAFASSDKAASPVFAADRYIPPQTKKVPYEIASGYLQIARRTRGFFRFAGLSSPFASGQGPEFEACDVTNALRLRSVAVMSIKYSVADAVGDVLLDKIKGLGGGQVNTDIGEKLAFTLCTTLQDVLASLFPSNAHRIAVLSPDVVRPLALGKSETAKSLANYVNLRLPRLLLLDGVHPETMVEGPASPLTDAVAGLVQQHAPSKALLEQFLSQAREAGSYAETPSLGAKAITIMVAEDSDHDLGVARAFVARRSEILEFWVKFLRHCDLTKGDAAEFAYSFNSKAKSTEFDFSAAARLVDGMIR